MSSIEKFSQYDLYLRWFRTSSPSQTPFTETQFYKSLRYDKSISSNNTDVAQPSKVKDSSENKKSDLVVKSSLIYYRIYTQIENQKLALSSLPGKEHLTSEKFQSEGEELDAQLWTPILLPNIGNDGCVLLNKLSQTFACVQNMGFLSLGLVNKKPSARFDEKVVFFLKNVEDNAENIQQRFISVGLGLNASCIIGWKDLMNNNSFLSASSDGKEVEILTGIEKFSSEALDAYQRNLPGKYSGFWTFESFK